MSVLITLYLAAMLWLLSHERYRSVWVGFLYTSIVKVPSSSGLMMVSRKGMDHKMIMLICMQLLHYRGIANLPCFVYAYVICPYVIAYSYYVQLCSYYLT